jgi:hypothetical protein
MNKEIKFSLFKNKDGYFVPNQTPTGSLDLLTLVRGIKESQDIKNLTLDYRREYEVAGKTEATDKIKKFFPHFTPVGEFEIKSNEGFILETWTDFVGFDIDRGDNPEMDWNALWDRICTTEFVGIAFKSPSNGIKGLIKVDLKMNKETFTQTVKMGVYPYFENLWRCKLDPKQATLSQSMFICWDPDVYAVENPIAFVPQKAITVFDYVPMEEKDDKHLIYLLRFLSECPKGQVFTQTQKSSILAAKMIKGGAWDIEKENALEILWQALKQSPGISDPKKAYVDLKAQFYGALNKKQFEPITKDDLTKEEFLKKIKKTITNGFWEENTTYFRIGTRWHKAPDSPSKDPILWNTESIKQDHSKQDAEEIIRKSPKYDGFINSPEYVNYHQIVEGRWNLAKDIFWVLKEGQWPTYEKVLTHIFGDKYEIVLDWLQISYQNPKHSLPVICLVSLEQNTGKTTFLWLLEILFGSNTVQISIEEFNGDFNSHFAHKNFILIDETETDDNLMKQVGPKIKRWVTQKKVNWHPKGITPVEIDYFGKLVICSNDETNFLKITQNDTRYWITKVPSLNEFDTELFDKLREEAGAFLMMLSQRKLKAEKKTRLWFATEDYITEEFNAAAELGKSWLYHELKELFLTDLEDRGLDAWHYGSTEIQDLMAKSKKSFDFRFLTKVMSVEFGLGKNYQKKVNGANKRGWTIDRKNLENEKVTVKVLPKTISNDDENGHFSLF